MAFDEYNMSESQQVRRSVQQQNGSSGDSVETPQINKAVRDLGKQKLKSFLAYGLAGAAVGSCVPGIGTAIGFAAGIGLRTLSIGVDTFEFEITKFNSDTNNSDTSQ